MENNPSKKQSILFFIGFSVIVGLAVGFTSKYWRQQNYIHQSAITHQPDTSGGNND